MNLQPPSISRPTRAVGASPPTMWHALRRLLLLVLLLLVAASPLSWADALDGELAVDSAFVNRVGGVYQLYARIEYPISDDMRAALRDGVSLSFNLEVEIARQRRYWLDASVTSIQLRRELSYHTVSERYVIREVGRKFGRDDAGENGQQAFATLEDALASLGTVDTWPILVAPQLRTDGEHRISVRASVRRGRLPEALRLLMFWTDDWHRASEWYTWSLPR